MAHVSPNRNSPETHSTAHKSGILKTKPSTLPPLQETGSHTKIKVKTRVKPVPHSKPTKSVINELKEPQELRMRERLNLGKIQAKTRLMRNMVRNQRTLLQEICNHEDFLSKLSEEMIQVVQDLEDSTALAVRATLQQQDTLVNVMDILEYSNRKRLQQLQSELLEWKEREERKINSLQQQVDQMDAKNKKTHEEVSFLSTYMDHEYPVRSVQIANLGRQVQQAKDSQQDELDNLNEMRKMVLESLSGKIWEKKKKILRSFLVKTLRPCEQAFVRKTRDIQERQRCRRVLQEIIGQMKAKIPTLRAEVKELQAQIPESREVVFQDILLRRPKCTPDMDVVLSICEEESLPF